MKAIPTTYQGVNFRSRLEAKWAAFFDAARWRWGYEPVDFNGWIPDFALYGARTVYVEVKPVTEFPEDVAQKIDRSGCEDEVLIVGQTVFQENAMCSESCFGWLRETGMASSLGERWNCWDLAVFGIWEGRAGFCHVSQSYVDRMSGLYEGNMNDNADRLREAWTSATNLVQWQPAKRGTHKWYQ